MGNKIDSIKEQVRFKSITVHCPPTPVDIPGIATADALDANDTLGVLFAIRVPKSGIIQAARFYDKSNQSAQVTAHLFSSNKVVLAASDAAWALSDADSLFEIGAIDFNTYKTATNNGYSFVGNLAIPYSLPKGYIYVGMQSVGTPTYTTPAWPAIQLVIFSDDPDYVEMDV